ncbi:MAG: hypothetical protein GXO03_06625 [Aquificae bacterium]|nr:hypothetical protein [Aquificota bacterium]
MGFIDLVVTLSFLFWLFVLLNPKLRKNRLWSATVTPLASIIGSGYLVSAPLMYFVLGDYAFLGMLGIVVLAYLVGEAIRFNILKAEPLLYGRYRFEGQGFLLELERLSSLVLAFAYMIAVAFYLRLLSAFIFSGFFERNPFLESLLSSALVLFIGVSGFLRGLDFLEFLEKYAVALNLSTIGAFLTGLLVYDLKHFSFTGVVKPLTFESLRVLAGVLLIVQGFETSKYLWEKYTPEERVKSMKLAQIISGFIYVSFMLLVTPLFKKIHETGLDETAIIALASALSVVMGWLIRVGPLMSQFSASVADTVGAGGLLARETRGRISSRTGYLLVSLVALVLIWSTNIFETIAYASKAFAFYYFLQNAVAWGVAYRLKEYKHLALFTFLAPVLLFITVFGKSAE